MAEVVIEKPSVNFFSLPLRRYGYNMPSALSAFEGFLRERGITPETHSTAIDLFAGDGSYARILIDNGWDPSNITCIDKRRSPTPLVRGVTWKYWDLIEIERRVLSGIRLPKEVTQFQSSFDLSVVMGIFGIDQRSLGQYFTKGGGTVFTQ